MQPSLWYDSAGHRAMQTQLLPMPCNAHVRSLCVDLFFLDSPDRSQPRNANPCRGLKLRHSSRAEWNPRLANSLDSYGRRGRLRRVTPPQRKKRTADPVSYLQSPWSRHEEWPVSTPPLGFFFTTSMRRHFPLKVETLCIPLAAMLASVKTLWCRFLASEEIDWRKAKTLLQRQV